MASILSYIVTRGVHSLLYLAYTCVQDLFIGVGVIYLAKKIIRWWYFTCKNPENIICDDQYFTCKHVSLFLKSTILHVYWIMNILDPVFLSHVVLRFLKVNSPRLGPIKMNSWPDDCLGIRVRRGTITIACIDMDIFLEFLPFTHKPMSILI